MSFNYSLGVPVATGSSIASAPVDLSLAEIAGAFNQHTTGAGFAHQVSSGAGGVQVAAAVNGTTAAATGATDLWTMLDRLANAVGILAGSSSAAGTWASLVGVVSGGGVAQATSANSANALVRRASDGAVAFGPTTANNISGYAVDSAHPGVRALGAAGDPSQFIFAVQNNAGSVNNFTVDNSGNAVARARVTAGADMVVGTVIYAGSGTTQLTDSVGLVRTAALPIVDGAHGGMGVDVTVSGNKPTARALLGAAASGVNADITALTGLTTAIGPALGGTGLISPAAGSIPVTNGSGNWLLLPPTPANYFVVSNGTTYVAQAFQTSMIPSGTLNQSVMSSLYPSAGTGGGNLLKAQAQPWAGFINGTWVNFAGGTGNYSPAIDPTGIGVGQSRIDLLVLNAAGNLAWSAGTPSATPSIAATPLPTSAAPIWYVKVYAGATSITGYTDTGSQAAFIQDARNLFGPTSVSAGGGGYLAGTYATMTNETANLPNSVRIGLKAFSIIGGDSDFTNAVDPFALNGGAYASDTTTQRNGKFLGNYRLHPSIIKSDDPLTAPYAASLDQWLVADFEARPRAYLYVSGNQVAMIACTIQINGVLKRSWYRTGGVTTITATATVASPSNTIYDVIADYTGITNGTFSLTVVPTGSATVTSSMRLLCRLRNTGSGFLPDPGIDWSPLGEVSSTQVRPLKQSKVGYPSPTTGVTSATPVPVTFFDGTLDLPRTMDIRVTGYIVCTGLTGVTGTIYLQLDSNILGIASPAGYGRSGAWSEVIPVGGPMDGILAGPHTIRLFAKVDSGVTLNVYGGMWEAIEWAPAP